jgi:hypothetical protein
MNMLTPLPDSKWNDATAAHLLNRAGFGGAPDEIERTRQKGLTAAVRDLVDVKPDADNVPPPAWAPPAEHSGSATKDISRPTDPLHAK